MTSLNQFRQIARAFDLIMKDIRRGGAAWAVAAASFVVSGCQTTAFIYYDEPLSFARYLDQSNGIDDGDALFTTFKIQQIENLSASAPLFTFDPSNVQILDFPPLPNGPN